jgi:hypothetical protein
VTAASSPIRIKAQTGNSTVLNMARTLAGNGGGVNAKRQ